MNRVTKVGIGLVVFQAVVMACLLFVVFGSGDEALIRLMGAVESVTPPAPQRPENVLSTFQPTAPIAGPATVPPTETATFLSEQATPTTGRQENATAAVTTYEVKQGDNLFRVALRFGITVEEIMAANNLDDASFVQAGQSLVIPVRPTATPAEGAEAIQSLPTNTPDATVEPTLAPLPPLPPTVNGVPLAEIAVIPPGTKRHLRAIFRAGQSLGNNPRAFSKVGDSTIENPFFLARFDEGPYNLGEFAHLQDVIDHYAGSYGRQGMAVRRGLHSWTAMDPAWADKRQCLANEGPIACEFRLHRPSILLIRLGSNDAGVPAYFEENMRQIVAYAIESGVIPVLGTKADRIEGSGNENNNILRQIAADFEVPLWDFDRLAGTMPGRGLDLDNVHLTTFYAHDYTSPLAMERGHAMHNLSALIVLDAIWDEVTQENP